MEDVTRLLCVKKYLFFCATSSYITITVESQAEPLASSGIMQTQSGNTGFSAAGVGLWLMISGVLVQAVDNMEGNTTASQATANQDTDIEHMPPNPNAMNPLPTGAHPHRNPFVSPCLCVLENNNMLIEEKTLFYRHSTLFKSTVLR
ncbi:hypothetical protein CHARACLAT_019708, partial [Characodon lateralis]|nr:hypothetical protein [Characodon lateralis]